MQLLHQACCCCPEVWQQLSEHRWRSTHIPFQHKPPKPTWNSTASPLLHGQDAFPPENCREITYFSLCSLPCAADSTCPNSPGFRNCSGKLHLQVSALLERAPWLHTCLPAQKSRTHTSRCYSAALFWLEQLPTHNTQVSCETNHQRDEPAAPLSSTLPSGRQQPW